jgi:murein DD-endopeptidase MepM/ murein hydrolase activator NlpD
MSARAGTARRPFQMKRARTLGMAVALLVGLQLALPAAGHAQLPPLPPVPSLVPLFPSPSGSPSPSPSASRKPPQGSSEKNANDQTKPGKKGAQPTTPPFRLSGPMNDLELVAILSQLTKLGVPLQRVLITGMGRFPVAGLSYWSDDWHAYRCCPSPHLHEGLDLFAERGTPLRSVANGTITRMSYAPTSAGRTAYVTTKDGTYYCYFHLDSYPKGLHVGQRVSVGDVVGYAGNTGNATGGPVHLHFEIHPGGGGAAPPKPFVDRWLSEAIKAAHALVARKADELAMAERVDFRLRRSLDLAGQAGEMDASAERLLFVAGLQPGVSSLAVARSSLDEMAWQINWADLTDAELAELAGQVATVATDSGTLALAPWGPFGPTLVRSDQVYGSSEQAGD